MCNNNIPLFLIKKYVTKVVNFDIKSLIQMIKEKLVPSRMEKSALIMKTIAVKTSVLFCRKLTSNYKTCVFRNLCQELKGSGISVLKRFVSQGNLPFSIFSNINR